MSEPSRPAKAACSVWAPVSASLGIVDWTMVGHAAFLIVMGLIGAYVANRRLDGMLRK